MIIMTYCFGKGQFWPIMALIVIHMVALAIGSIVSRVCHIGQSCNIELVLYSCFFGLANIYCPNWISYQNKDEKKHGKHTYTILREVVIHIVLILENFAMLSTVIYCAVWKQNSSIYKQNILMKLGICKLCSSCWCWIENVLLEQVPHQEKCPMERFLDQPSMH